MRKAWIVESALFRPTVLYRDDKKEYMRQYQKFHVRYWLTALVNSRGGKCEDCGEKQDLHFAHIKPTKVRGKGRGMAVRQRDIKQNPDCYKLLCKTCHTIKDKGDGTWCNPYNYRGLKS